MRQTAINIVFLSALWTGVNAQNSVALFQQHPDRRVITTAVPFLNFAPDSRHSAMGDAGVATSPDASSAHWNSGKLSFSSDDHAISLSYSPWLGRTVPDMSLVYLSGFKKIDDVSAFGLDLRYFDMGSIRLTDGNGNGLGDFNPRDMAIGGTYSRKLSDRLSLGVSARFIHSNLSGQIGSQGSSEGRPGVSLGADVGLFYQIPLEMDAGNGSWAFGMNISNIGPRITYNSAEDLDYLPSNLRIGTAFTLPMNAMNSITFAFDVNKLMVPTPPLYRENADGSLVMGPDGRPEIESGRNPDRPLFAGIFGSFSDSPNGFAEEIQELTYSLGAEYSYDGKFMLRAGYFSEHGNKGGRRYFTGGLGFRHRTLGIDFSYLVPQVQNHPLGETIRISLAYIVGN